MNICVFTDEVSSDFDRALQLSKASGAESVELRGGLFGHDVTNSPPEVVEQVRRALDHHGLVVSSIGSPLGKCKLQPTTEWERQLEFLPRLMELGRALDCRLVRGFAFWNPRPEQRACLPEHLDSAAGLLRPALEKLEGAGFLFGLELAAETLVATSHEFHSLRSAVAHNPALQVVWDLAAQSAAGEETYPAGYQALRGLIAHVHIKPGEDGTLKTAPGSKASHRELLQTLLDDGYTGAVSIEHWGSSASMLRGVRELKSTVESLR